MSDHTKPPWHADEHGVYIWANDERGDFPVAQLRGWGHLTGAGGLNLSPEEAIAIQKANAAFIVRAANCHDDILRELRHLVRLLETLEWSCVARYGADDRCPTCEGYRWQGHVDGCELAARLNGARAAIARATAPGGTE